MVNYSVYQHVKLFSVPTWLTIQCINMFNYSVYQHV